MFPDVLRDAARNLRANPMRVGLTTLGMIWGVAILTVLSAYAIGFEQHFKLQLAKVGQRVVYFYPGVALKPNGGARGARSIHLDDRVVPALRGLPAIEGVSPEVQAGLRVLRGSGRNRLIWVHGVGHEAASIRNFQAGSGRFFTHREVAVRARVAFLGQAAADRLFAHHSAVGETISIDSISFTVVGVSAGKGSQMIFVGPKDDELVLVPYTTAQRWLTHNTEVQALMIAPRERKDTDRAVEYAKLAIAFEHSFQPGQDGSLGIFNLRDAILLIEDIAVALRIFLSATGAITVVVGAVGVMNIMLVAVSERRSEIGVRRALGAPTWIVFGQFLAESMLVTLAAGIVGAALGAWTVSVLAQEVLENSVFAPSPVLNREVVTYQAAVLLVAGTCAGILPALRAARVEPSIALRTV